MKHHFVIDTSVYIRLEKAVMMYGMTVYINENIIGELGTNLTKVKKTNPNNISDIVKHIVSFTIYRDTIPIFKHSPNPDDNFLFDLAIQTGSEAIITKEKALLGFAASPVPIHDIMWFKETFPVPL